MNKEHIKLKSCPFCGKIPDMEDGDTMHPSGIFHRPNKDYGKVYVGHKDKLETDHSCWLITCPEMSGGCGAEMHGDSIKEVIEKWNNRI